MHHVYQRTAQSATPAAPTACDYHYIHQAADAMVRARRMVIDRPNGTCARPGESICKSFDIEPARWECDWATSAASSPKQRALAVICRRRDHILRLGNYCGRERWRRTRDRRRRTAPLAADVAEVAVRRARNGQNDYINYHRIKSINAVSAGCDLMPIRKVKAARTRNIDYD